MVKNEVYGLVFYYATHAFLLKNQQPRVNQLYGTRAKHSLFSTGMKATLSCNKLKKIYNKREVVKSSSIEVKQGKIVGLLGPNGAGKTTTFYMIVGLVRPDGGDVFLDNENITAMAMYKRARLGIGYLPQEASVFRNMTVEENILSVLEFTSLSEAARKERTGMMLEELNITSIRKSMGYALSGGERRRTEIARALALNPKFILLDEPFAGVDPIAVEDIQQIVEGLARRDIGVLITDHNVHETLSITDHAYLLFDGSIFMHGTPEEIAANPVVREMYLGVKFTLDRYQTTSIASTPPVK